MELRKKKKIQPHTHTRTHVVIQRPRPRTPRRKQNPALRLRVCGSCSLTLAAVTGPPQQQQQHGQPSSTFGFLFSQIAQIAPPVWRQFTRAKEKERMIERVKNTSSPTFPVPDEPPLAKVVPFPGRGKSACRKSNGRERERERVRERVRDGKEECTRTQLRTCVRPVYLTRHLSLPKAARSYHPYKVPFLQKSHFARTQRLRKRKRRESSPLYFFPIFVGFFFFFWVRLRVTACHRRTF